MCRLNSFYFEIKSNDENKKKCQYAKKNRYHIAVISVGCVWIYRRTVALLTENIFISKYSCFLNERLQYCMHDHTQKERIFFFILIDNLFYFQIKRYQL